MYLRRCIIRSVETIAVSVFPKIARQSYYSQMSTGRLSIIDVVLLVKSVPKSAEISKKLNEHCKNSSEKKFRSEARSESEKPGLKKDFLR